MGRVEFELHPFPPFSLELSARFFSDGDPQIRTYENGRFWQVIQVPGTLVLATISSAGSTDDPSVTVELASSRRIPAHAVEAAKSSCSSLFNMDLDLTEFYRNIAGDRVLSSLARQLRGLKIPASPTVYESVVTAIIEQQLSLDVSYSIWRKFVGSFGETLAVSGRTYFAFPAPERIAGVDLDEIHACGISIRKSEYIRDISAGIRDGAIDLEELKKEPSAEAISEKLEAMRGIGTWSAEYALLRGMHRFEAIPAGDVGIRRALSRYFRDGVRMTAEEARELAGPWGRWKGLAAFYVMMADWLDISPVG